MITTRKIRIKKIGDYKGLLRIIPTSHIDQAIVAELSGVYGLNCRSIIVEYPYYESDYLSTYYIFYAKKLKPFPKKCYRLLFFSDDNCSNLIGYISLRPTYDGTHLGRTYLEPAHIISQHGYLILANSKVHFMGGEVLLNIFPHMKQEGDVAVCAHVALWSVLRSFTNRFHRYPEVRLGKIVEAVQPKSERLIPSKGLSISQISDVLLQFDFSSLIISDSKTQNCSDEILTFIESGIPVIGVSSNACHAVAIVGHDKPELDKLGGEIPSSWFETPLNGGNPAQSLPEVLLSTKLINSYFVNDDNFFPYRIVSKIPFKSETYYTVRNKKLKFRLQDFDYAIVPLYQWIQLGYQETKSIFMALVQTGIYNWTERIVVRMFISSANTYKQYVYENRASFGRNIADIITSLEMPRFIWCIEVSMPQDFAEEMVNAIVIIDSTSATISADPFLFITERDQIRFLDSEEQKAYCMPLSLPKVPCFRKNLQEV